MKINLKIPAVIMDLFALLSFFFFIQFFLAILMMNTAQEEKPTAKPRAEVLVTSTWEAIKHDVDIWIERVDHEICGYSRRETGPFILHGDHTSIHYGKVDGVPVKEATETISINKLVPGTYRISLHGFSIRDGERNTDVEVELVRVDPFKRHFKLKFVVTNGEELPICQFEITPDKQIKNIKTDSDVLFKFLSERRGF